MMNVLFFSSIVLYFIASVLQLFAMVFKKDKLKQAAWVPSPPGA